MSVTGTLFLLTWLIWLKVDSNSFLPKTNAQSGGERVTSRNEVV